MRSAQTISCVSWVRPDSSVTGSNFVRPGSLRTVDGPPASRHSMTSVERLIADIFDRPATYWLSHLTRNLKFLYGSSRWVFTENGGTASSSRGGLGLLAEFDDDELGGAQRREPHEDVHDARGLVDLRRRLGVDLHEVGVIAGAPGERPVAELDLHEAADRRPQARPQRLVVGLEHRPLDPVVDAGPQEDRGPADGDVAPFTRRLHRPRAPDHAPGARDPAQCVDPVRVELVAVQIGQVV